ncbi:MAG: hypothetical protein RL375_4 [Pseudomonadota bacterium]|jgi:hypothetical protein
MRIEIDTKAIDEAVRQVAELPKQLNFATALALTRTAQRVADAERAEMRDSFDRPTPFTLGAVFVRPAKPSNPEAIVGIKNDSGGARPPVNWLRWQIYGGLRTQTAYERLLVGNGAMRNSDRMVPGRFARLDAFGNISRGQLVQILSQLRIESSTGSARGLPRLAFEDTKRDRNRKKGVIRRAYQRAGGQYVAFPNGRGKLLPGIYQVRATAFGRSDPRPVLIFVSKASYEAGRFDFEYTARTAVQRHLQAEVQAAVAQTLATARPRT